MSRLLAIYDSHECIMERLKDFLRESEDFPFSVSTYLDLEKLKNDMELSKLAIILIEDIYISETIKQLAANGGIQLIAFSGETKPLEELPCIFRFQSAGNIKKEILKICLDNGLSINSLAGIKKSAGANSTTVLAVYTPYMPFRRKEISVSLGQLLAEKGKCLYLNVRGFHDMDVLEDNDNICDLLFFSEENKERFYLKLKSIIRENCGYYYVEPVKNFFMMEGIDSKPVINIINRICEMNEYKYLLIELSEEMSGFTEVLKSCHVIITFLERGNTSFRERYEASLKASDLEELSEKTKYVYIGNYRPDIRNEIKEAISAV